MLTLPIRSFIREKDCKGLEFDRSRNIAVDLYDLKTQVNRLVKKDRLKHEREHRTTRLK